MTAQLAPVPVFKGWDNNGNPLANGQLFTYQAGTSTPQVAYTDASQGTPLTNPAILNARGEVAIWLDPTLTYKMVLEDSQGNFIWSQDQIVGGYIPVTQLSTYVNQQFIGQTLYPRTAAEIAASVTPTSYFYPPGDWRRYGADPTGTNDSTAAINQSLLCNDNSYGITGTYKCSAPLLMQSGQTMYGDGSGTVLQYADGSINNIVMSNITGSTVRDLKINITGTNGSAKSGAVYMEVSTACRVERVEATGYNWSGIWMNQCNKCALYKNYLHDAPALLNTTSNGADINLWSTSGTAASNYTVIEGNQCFGVNTAFGIMLIDPDAATAITGYPLRNVVALNRIGTHTTYGIGLYLPGTATTAADTFNEFIGNWIENITGLSCTAFNPLIANTSSGAGIYCVGKGIGGTVVKGNQVTNCCSGTLLRNLAPAGIGINGVQTGVTPPLVSGNSVDGMTQGDGILATSCPGGVLISDNSINMPSSNTGGGAGGASLLGSGIRVEATSNFVIGPNNVQMLGTGPGLFIYANGVNSDTGSITGGIYRQLFAPGGATSSSPAVQVTQNGGFTPQNMTFAGVRATTANAQVANDAFSINSAISITLSGCQGAASTGRGLLVNTSTLVRVTGGSYTTSTGSAAVATSATCTSGFMDESVYTGASATLINNAGTGFTIKTRLSAVPAAGTWAIGDTVFNLTPTAAGVFLWVTTTAGAGTWKTVSNT